MAKHKHGSHLDQGPTGAGRTRKSGSHLEQGEGGARKGPSIAAQGGEIPAAVPAAKGNGSHLTPDPALTDMTADRQGGTIAGHDRVNPNLGKAHSQKHVSTRVL